MNVTQLCATFDPEIRLSTPQRLRGDLSFLSSRPEDPCLLSRMLAPQEGCTLTGFPLGFHRLAYQVDQRTLHANLLGGFVRPFTAGRGLVNGQTSRQLCLSVPQPVESLDGKEGKPYQDAYCLLQNRNDLLPWSGDVVVFGPEGRRLASLLGGKTWERGEREREDALLVVLVQRKPGKWDEVLPWEVGAFPVWKHTLVVLACESALETESWKEHVDAILSTFTHKPDNQLLADLIRGKRCPSGCLPYAMPRQIPAGWSVRRGCLVPVDRWGVVRIPPFFGYRARKEHAFCFGHGLTYTTFAFHDLQVEKTSLSFQVGNIGKRAASAPVEIYVQHLESRVPQPAAVLRDFCRVPLEPGESRTVTIPLDDRLVSVWDDESWAFVRGRGSCLVQVGTSSESISLCAELTL